MCGTAHYPEAKVLIRWQSRALLTSKLRRTEQANDSVACWSGPRVIVVTFDATSSVMNIVIGFEPGT